jgi:peroxiredoxin
MPREALQAGTPAPEFELESAPDQSVRLTDFRGGRLIMAFYPADWSPVCTDQMALYNEILPEFQRLGATLVGVSIDHAWCHMAFAQSRNLHFPLLADFHPKGAVAKAYDVWSEDFGVSGRALVMIDPDGLVQWSYLSPPLEVPGANLIFDALEQRTPA